MASLVWHLSGTVSYANGTWKTVSVVSDDDGFRTDGDATILPDLYYDQTMQQVLALAGYPIGAGNVSPSVTDATFRFSATLANGGTYILGSMDLAPISPTGADLAEVSTALAADSNFIQTMETIYGPTDPRLVLTVSGLAAGVTFMGFGNGVHTITPMFYATTGFGGGVGEVWVWMNMAAYSGMYIVADPYYTSPSYADSLVVAIKAPSFMFAADITPIGTVGYHNVNIATNALPLSAGPITAKVKNRMFGHFTTTAGVSISWQRAANWPSNP